MFLTLVTFMLAVLIYFLWCPLSVGHLPVKLTFINRFCDVGLFCTNTITLLTVVSYGTMITFHIEKKLYTYIC